MTNGSATCPTCGHLREATEKLQAHNEHLQRMLSLPSARKDIKEAEARVWEECFKEICNACKEGLTAVRNNCGVWVHEGFCECQASALRSKKAGAEGDGV